MTIKIAQLSCGTEYSSVQYEIEKAARSVGAKIVYPDVSAADIDDAVKRFGFNPRSPQLKLMIARAAQLADGKGQNHLQHLPHHLRVEGCGNFVQQQNFRVHTQRPDNGHPLLLTAGQLSGIVVPSVFQPHLLQ